MRQKPLIAALALFGAAVPLVAAGGGPTVVPAALTAIRPVGARRGETVTFTLTGLQLQGATEAVFDDPAITGRVAPGANANTARVTATIGATARRGIHRVHLRTPQGTTGSVAFAVGDWPELPEREPNDSDGGEIAFPATLTGAIDRPGDVDAFRFSARAGQELVFEVVAQPLGSTLVSVLTLESADGRVLAEARGRLGRLDAVLGWRCETPGTYLLKIRDFENKWGDGVFYRINAGEFRYATTHFPLGVRAGSSGEIHLEGFNLGEPHRMVTVPADAARDSLVALPEPDDRYVVQPVRVAVGHEPERSEAEATGPLPLPIAVHGRIARAGEVDEFRFRARRGEPLILEVMARRAGSPLDSVIEVMDAAGKPVERATLRPVSQTVITLGDRDSAAGSFRLAAWTDLRINDYVYCRGELLQVADLPKGPDEDVRFKSFRGQRLGLLDTTPTAHAVNTPVYKVLLYPPGQQFPPNGMPLFRLFYRNDDGGPLYGKDSRLRFEAPADGEYRVRLADVRGQGGPDYAYRLTLRPPEPDFRLVLGNENPNLAAGAGVPVEVTAERLDDFAGPIDVALEGLPAGVSATAGQIEAGQFSAVLLLTADAEARSRTVPLRVVGRANLGGRSLVRTAEPPASGRHLAVLGRDLDVTTREREIVLRPGGETTLTVRIERRNGFAGRVPIELRNLPFGVRVMNVGLNGVLIPEGQRERTVFLACEPWVAAQTRRFYCVARVETGSPIATEIAAAPLTLTVLPAADSR